MYLDCETSFMFSEYHTIIEHPVVETSFTSVSYHKIICSPVVVPIRYIPEQCKTGQNTFHIASSFDVDAAQV
jgi:hypothetical protein